MGREVRRVPANWQHPKDKKGHEIPLFGMSYSKELAEWKEGKKQWLKGYRKDFITQKWVPREEDEYCSWEEWHGPKPQKKWYMPEWKESEKTHYQMYENVTEGTPISPVMESPEALAKWLTENNASAFGGETASYEAWLEICRGGFAPSAVILNGQMTSGVQGVYEYGKKE